MKKILNIFVFSLVISVIYSCKDDDKSQISPIDISENILGEWVYDNPLDGSWQSMKFSENGKFYYSEDKNDWANALKGTDGYYSLDGMNVFGYRAGGALYVDMTIQHISDYSFTTRYKNTALDFTFNKVLMRTHLNFAESVIPPYSDLVDKEIISFKSHDDKIATVDANTGEITAVVKDGRTYIDLTTSDGTACIKVMIGQINDGDENEISTIPNKKEPIQIVNVDIAKMIVGPLWVYDHPEEKVWEVIRFVESGNVYYSNKNGDWDFENENTNGTYKIDQKTITGNVKLYGTISMDFYWVVTTISDMEFTIKAYTSGAYVGRFTYAKQLETLNLVVGDLSSPNYQQLVGDVKIIGFKSHNSSCISVDNETGEISALSGGHTYVDIITDNGTAVISVNVERPKSFWNMNYKDFLGTKWNVVANTFGTAFTRDETKKYMYYDYSEGSLNDKQNTILDENWETLAFYFDPDQNTGIVKAIILVQKADAWFTAEEMNRYLRDTYYVYGKGTEDNFKAFINNEDFEKATIGITWDMENKVLMFQSIN